MLYLFLNHVIIIMIDSLIADPRMNERILYMIDGAKIQKNRQLTMFNK